MIYWNHFHHVNLLYRSYRIGFGFLTGHHCWHLLLSNSVKKKSPNSVPFACSEKIITPLQTKSEEETCHRSHHMVGCSVFCEQTATTVFLDFNTKYKIFLTPFAQLCSQCAELCALRRVFQDGVLNDLHSFSSDL